MAWIELTETARRNRPATLVLINIETGMIVKRGDRGNTMITLGLTEEAGFIFVDESYEKVKEAILGQVAATKSTKS